MSDIDSFDPFDPRNPAYRVPIARQQFNTFRFPGFGQDPELVTPAPAPAPPTTPGDDETPAGLRGAFGVRSQEDTQPGDNPSFRGNQPGGGGISLDAMSDAQLLNHVATIGDDPIISALTAGPSFMGQTFGYLDELNQILTYNARFGTSFRTLDEVRADATARLTNQPLSPLALGPVVQQAPSGPAAAGQPAGRGVVPDTGLSVPTPDRRPEAPLRAVPGAGGSAIPDSGTPFRPPIPGRRPPTGGDRSPLESIGNVPLPDRPPTPPRGFGPRPERQLDVPVPGHLQDVPLPDRKPTPPEQPARETAAASKPDTPSSLTAAPPADDRSGSGFSGGRDRTNRGPDRDRGNDREDRGISGRDTDRGSRGGRDRSRDRGARGPSGSNRR